MHYVPFSSIASITPCAGNGGHIPVIGYTGNLQMGSTNFAVTLSKANGVGAVQAWFAVGASRATIPFGTGCTLLVNPGVIVVTGGGRAGHA